MQEDKKMEYNEFQVMLENLFRSNKEGGPKKQHSYNAELSGLSPDFILKEFSTVGIKLPRQVGKSTWAKDKLNTDSDVIYVYCTFQDIMTTKNSFSLNDFKDYCSMTRYNGRDRIKRTIIFDDIPSSQLTLDFYRHMAECFTEDSFIFVIYE